MAATAAALATGKDLLWDSGTVTSDASVLRDYAGPPVRSATMYYWRVRVWDARGRVSAWSHPGSWEMGLLKPADWTAQWIRPPWDDPEKQSAPGRSSAAGSV